MLEVKLICIGKLKEKYWRDAVQEYAKRLSAFCRFQIIELSEEELNEIFADEDFENGDKYEQVRSFVFSNLDPYAKVEPRPDNAPSVNLLLTKRATSL